MCVSLKFMVFICVSMVVGGGVLVIMLCIVLCRFLCYDGGVFISVVWMMGVV